MNLHSLTQQQHLARCNTWGIQWNYDVQPSGGVGGGDHREQLSTCMEHVGITRPMLPLLRIRLYIPVILGPSPDGGLTFYVAYQAPAALYGPDGYDTPHFNFGYDGSGSYGIFMNCDYFASHGQILSLYTDAVSWNGFLPFTGPMSNSTTATVTGSISPLVITTGSVTYASTTLIIADATVVLIPGQAVSGLGIPSGAYIVSGSAGSFVMSVSATASASSTAIVACATLTVTAVTVGVLSVVKNFVEITWIPPSISIQIPVLRALSLAREDIGTYSVDISQTTPSTTIYAAIIPLGPVQLTNTSTSISPLSDGTLLANQTTIYVESVEGFLEAGYLQINGYTITYNGQTLQVSTTATGAGLGDGIVNVVSTEGFALNGAFYYTSDSQASPSSSSTLHDRHIIYGIQDCHRQLATATPLMPILLSLVVSVTMLRDF